MMGSRDTLYRLRPLTMPLGAVLLATGQRALAGGAVGMTLSILGAALIALAVAWPWLPARMLPTGRDAAAYRRGTTLPAALVLLAVALYFADGLLVGAAEGGSALADVLRAMWRLGLLAGMILHLFVELAVASQARMPVPDARRLNMALSGGVTLSLLAALVAMLNFNLGQLSWRWDLTYFQSTEPSEYTLEVVRDLDDVIEVAAFFAADNEVGRLVGDYFAAINQADPGGRLKTSMQDAALTPEKADEFEARDNGWVILRRGETRATLNLGTDMERAKNQMRKFDQTFLRKLLELGTEKQTVYFTVGHGERNEAGNNLLRQGRGYNTFRNMLRERNYTVKTVGYSNGLDTKVPEDAALLIIAAPTQPFFPDELKTLDAFLQNKGRLMVFTEPVPAAQSPLVKPAEEGGMATLYDLLAKYGIEHQAQMLAHDRHYARLSRTRADQALLVTNGFEKHPALGSVKNTPDQFRLIFMDAGQLNKGKVPEGLVVTDMLKGMPETWVDANRNFIFESGREIRTEPLLAATVTAKPPEKDKQKTPRPRPGPPEQVKAGDGPTLMVFGDADVASDMLLQNRANQLVLEETVSWMVGRKVPPTLPNTEEDVRIRHAKADQWVWFYLPVLGIPALIMLVGIVQVRRLRNRGRGKDE